MKFNREEPKEILQSEEAALHRLLQHTSVCIKHQANNIHVLRQGRETLKIVYVFEDSFFGARFSISCCFSSHQIKNLLRNGSINIARLAGRNSRMPGLRRSFKARLVCMAHSTIRMMDHNDRTQLSNSVKCEDRAHRILSSTACVANDCAFGEIKTEELLGDDARVAARDDCCRCFAHFFGFHDTLLEERG